MVGNSSPRYSGHKTGGSPTAHAPLSSRYTGRNSLPPPLKLNRATRATSPGYVQTATSLPPLMDFPAASIAASALMYVGLGRVRGGSARRCWPLPFAPARLSRQISDDPLRQQIPARPSGAIRHRLTLPHFGQGFSRVTAGHFVLFIAGPHASLPADIPSVAARPCSIHLQFKGNLTECNAVTV